MANLNLKSFNTLVQNQAAAIQARSRVLVDFTVGSILRATVEAGASIGIWLESLIVYVLSITRASTSERSDLDSWMADFGLLRLGSISATGLVTFSRFTGTSPALIPVGAQIRTADGTQFFTVISDITNSAFDPAQDGFVIPATVLSLSVPVQASTPGSVANVGANTITVLASSLPGVDYVTNAGPLTTGVDAENDQAFRSRFPNFLQSLSKATRQAITYAVQSLGLGLQVQIVEFQSYAGAAQSGFFYVVFDDGSGAPSDALRDRVYQAVDAVRAQGIQFGVFKPTVTNAAISFEIVVAAGFSKTALIAMAGTKVGVFVNSLGLGSGLPYTRLLQVIYDTSAGILNVKNLTVNGVALDIAPDPRATVKVTSVAVTAP